MGTYEQTMLKLEKMAQATNAQQMNWQEKMTKNSHQMEVADLVKAGLNPVLSSGGSGAQSYTTSLDSAASAVGNLASAHESASAQRYAARQSAAAQRAAAAANLAAAREAASAQRYSADRSYESSKYSTDNSKTGNAWGVLSRALNKVFGDGYEKKFANGVMKDVKDFYTSDKYKKSSLLNYSWLNLTKIGQNKVSNALKKSGVPATSYYRNLYIDAFLNGNEKKMQRWKAAMKVLSKTKNSSSSLYRSGSGIW